MIHQTQTIMTPEQQESTDRYDELYRRNYQRLLKEEINEAERTTAIIIYVVSAVIGLCVSLGVITAFYFFMKP